MSIRILAVAVTLLLVISGRQYSDIRKLRVQLAECGLNSRRAAADAIAGKGGEIARAIAWLDAYYRWDQGLQRPNGLWIHNHPDFEGIGTWIFDVYLQNRLAGRTEAEAQHLIETAIRGSDEWRAKHPAPR